MVKMAVDLTLPADHTNAPKRQSYGFCMVSCISHMDTKLIEAIGCVTGVIEFLC